MGKDAVPGTHRSLSFFNGPCLVYSGLVMPPRALSGLVLSLLSIIGCGSASVPPAAGPAQGHHIDASASRCESTAPPRDPIVTEWPASEKANLQSLASERLVAVSYTGCDLRVIPECTLEGSYRWVQTTAATDTLDINNADELYAKLPIGAVALEGELERSGRLAMQTTVVGQLRLVEPPAPENLDAACRGATHFVTAISVGSFKLFSGSASAAGGEVGIAGFGPSGRSSRQQITLREAGDPAACATTTGESPASQCASPIQVFLQPLRTPSAGVVASATHAPASPPALDPARIGVHVAFPPPKDKDEVWTLRDRTGARLCTLPCAEWIEPAGGYYLQRERPRAELRLPPSLPHRPGTEVTAEYQLRRGQPGFSTWLFYLVGLPSAALGAGLGTWAVVQASTGCEKDEITGREDCFPDTGFLVSGAIMYLAVGGASFWWYRYSRKERFDTYERVVGSAGTTPVGLAPSGLRIHF